MLQGRKSLLCIVLDFAGFVELIFHRGVLVGKLANGEIFYLVVGKAEVVVGLEEVVLHFLEVGDGLVDDCEASFISILISPLFLYSHLVFLQSASSRLPW